MLSRHDAICDLLFRDEECLALVDDQLLRLGPVASHILLVCETPQSRHSVQALLIERFGQPPGDAVELVAELIRELTQRRLLAETEHPADGDRIG